MQPKDVKITLLEKGNGSNLLFLVEYQGFAGRFRIAYKDKTRKNARFEDWQLIDVYFEASVMEFGTSIENAVDVLQWIERKSRWILEDLRGQYSNRFYRNKESESLEIPRLVANEIKRAIEKGNRHIDEVAYSFGYSEKEISKIL